MGPSGSGKSTLLDILSLREGKGSSSSSSSGGGKGGREGGKGTRVGGEVALVLPGEKEEAVELGREGGRKRAREVKRAFGFLDQEHRLTPTLTVGESVLMAAVLRGGGREGGMEERQKRVRQVLISLHIDHLVHARIGAWGGKGGREGGREGGKEGVLLFLRSCFAYLFLESRLCASSC